jgi:hypothetical protein
MPYGKETEMHIGSRVGRSLPLRRTAVIVIAFLSLHAFGQIAYGQELLNSDDVIAQGGGTTIVEAGVGSPTFTPVVTKVAFHVERRSGGVTGDLECLALVPAAAAGAGSGAFTVNAMYVTGKVSSARVTGDEVTIVGLANVTGVGAGTDVPFNFVTRNGGPGTSAVLTTGDPGHTLVFHEVLLEGAFRVGSR